MASYRWAAPISSDWNVATAWTPAQVPNDPTADVTIDNPTLAAYLVTIAAGETETVNSLTMNSVNNLSGSNQIPYKAAEMELSGTLAFAPGSPGSFGGSLQTFLQMTNGTMINPGTVDAFIQTVGNVLLTGTNGFYVTNWLQSLGAITTIDVKSIAEMTGNVLFDGIYEAKGDGAIINLGGPRQNLIVNIATIEGPPLIPDGWTELILNGKVNDIGEWNGTKYVPIESTLTEIANRGTYDIIGGRDYNTTLPLTVSAGGLLNLQAGVVTTGLLNINGGAVQGSGTLNSGVINNGTLRALDGVLTVGAGGLVGNGLVSFDFDQKFGTVAAVGATMEVHGVGPGQLFVMNGDDQLVIDTPASFAGTIQAKTGDAFFLGGIKATSASLQGQTLVLLNGVTAVGSLNLSGNYAANSFAVTAFGASSTEVKVTAKPATTSAATGGIYTSDAANISADALYFATSATTAFVNGGSSFVTGTVGSEAFSIDVRNASSTSLSTIADFHSGDSLTVFGVSLADFSVSLANNGGAAGSSGLTLSFTEAGHATSSVVLSGYSISDLLNGRLSQTLSTTGSSGVPYLTIHAT